MLNWQEIKGAKDRTWLAETRSKRSFVIQQVDGKFIAAGNNQFNKLFRDSFTEFCDAADRCESVVASPYFQGNPHAEPRLQTPDVLNLREAARRVLRRTRQRQAAIG